jgi:hypothetical protein
VISALMIAFALQSTSLVEPVQTKRISEELYYLHPYRRGIYPAPAAFPGSGSHGRSQIPQTDRCLEAKGSLILGEDLGFDVVPIGKCARSEQVGSAAFASALDQFDRDLTVLEARYR